MLRAATRRLLPAFAAPKPVFGLAAEPRRHLNVHEYVSMGLMQEYGVPVPRSAVATTPDEAEHHFVTKFPGGGACSPGACVVLLLPLLVPMPA